MQQPQQQQHQLSNIIYDPSLQQPGPSSVFGSSLNVMNSANLPGQIITISDTSINSSLQQMIPEYNEIPENEELKQLLKTWKLEHLYNYLRSKIVIF